MLQEAVRKYATEQIKPKVSAMDAAAKMDPVIIKELFEQGLFGIEIPEKYGGSGMSFTSALVAIEELAKIDASVSVMVDVHNTLINNMFKKWASEDMKNQYLPRLASGMLGSFCLSESGSGSDAFALKTKAEADGDYYVINGSKLWITNAGEAGVFLVMANVDFAKKHRGITCFVVERDTPGLEIHKKEDKLGIRASSTHPLSFTDMRVHKSKILGEVGQGYSYAIQMLNEGRIGIGAQMVGLAQGALESTLPYLYQRKQFGTFIGDFQAQQVIYGQLAVEIEAARLLVYNAARMQQLGLPFVKEAAMAKLFSGQVAEKTSSKCIELVGGVGISKEYPQEKYFRDCKVGSIYEGTSNIQLTTIAKLLAEDYKPKKP